MASEAEWLRNRQDVVWEGGPEYERKRRRQKWTVGLVSLVSLVGLGIMLAWLVRWSDRDVVKGN